MRFREYLVFRLEVGGSTCMVAEPGSYGCLRFGENAAMQVTHHSPYLLHSETVQVCDTLLLLDPLRTELILRRHPLVSVKEAE